MAYVDVDKFAEAVCNFQQIDEDAANAMIWLLRTFSKADVVPKSDYDKLIGKVHRLEKYDEERDIALHARLISEAETRVAEKIFSDIEGLFHILVGNETGKEFYSIVASEYAEIKKKYKVGDTNDNKQDRTQ